MKKFDKYILLSYIKTFLFALGILAVISSVIDYSEKVDNFVKYKAPAGAILKYFITFIPHILALLYPLFIFLSTIFFTSKLAFRSEFIAIQSAGVKFRRILRPYIIGSIIVGLVSLTFNHFLVPYANKSMYQFQKKYVSVGSTNADENVHIRIAPNKYLFFQNFNFQTKTAQAFTEETFDSNRLVKKIFADKVKYNDSTKKWVIDYVVIRTNDGLKEKLDTLQTMTMDYDIQPYDLEESIYRKETLTSPQLYKQTYLNKNRGMENINAYQYELHRRTADAIAGIILSIIAVSIASRKVRGGSGLHLAVGIAISAVFLLFIQFSKTFTTNTNFNPLLAAWIPNIAFSIIAYYLYLKRSR